MEPLQKLTKQLKRWHKVISDCLLFKTCYKNANLFGAAGVTLGEVLFLHCLFCCDIVFTGSGVEVCKLFRHVLSEDSLFPVTLTRKETYLQLTQVTVYCCLSPYRQSLHKPGDANITLFVAG
jgi:hypothetical protein